MIKEWMLTLTSITLNKLYFHNLAFVTPKI